VRDPALGSPDDDRLTGHDGDVRRGLEGGPTSH
jgi:hypothetical protein